MLTGFLDAVFNGISIGSVLLIAALGLAIIFGLMGVINMAHGELMMFGAYTTFVVQNGCKQLGGFWFEIYIFLALIIAFFFTAFIGLILERGVIRHLYGRPLETLLATWGVSLIFQQFVRSVNWVLVIGLGLFSLLFFGGLWVLNSRTNLERIRNWVVAVIFLLSLGVTITTGNLLSQTYQLAVTQPWFGAQNVDVTAPRWLQTGVSLGGVQLPFARLFIIALTIICVGGIYLFLQRSSWGLRIRAVTQNRSMSACLGIPTEKVDAITFALGSGLAGVAGCAISLLGSVGPNTGQNYIIDTFMVVVVGGVGNLAGTIVAALGIGTANFLIGSGTIALLSTPVKPLADFLTFFATTSMAKVMVFVLIILFLQWKPAGIFPQKGRSVDV
ncbi:urea ABC transporter membrane protein [Trichormus variabilis ATCC 29413]|uniref:Urea ABC transporter membrane protein n=2 Tax=Anabaena variabilis TaxID=264691 RepID=Q3M4X6_TRIV2|nr:MULTISPECIES: urea ABC transporter permease subunit UrtB [Nostocaceae]ABA23960.1 urea ABC transporter membrane protein [Trichormus variabilis ATCC 29413]MBC1214887.1 urea ABC transporter permease subunit UrtB [Trichormus variabilis ARAD]MBC1254668.1 urea ABC transporter permease subunit UrtB [Trichormus variabilis V5]MBC1268810.1 urea ABC transporter permease subunit UrtB [Trichormus variabilis FSR]MBC1303139.1 urea ABC transporter permease subunit UrtB [Trichormus variabilis N2B]